MEAEDTEITLGVGKLLGLFFLLAAICGVFFSIGYSLGKSSGREQALNDQPASAVATGAPALPTSTAKPSADVAPKPEGQLTVDEPTAAAQAEQQQQPNLTFYNSVKQDDTTTAAAPSESTKQATDARHPKVVEAAAPPATSPAKTSAPPEVIAHTNPVTGPGTIVVQIAAVSREDDAVALAGALRKKDYNVFVVNNPVTHDKFYHVQVGPFSTVAEAEAMKAKLVAEGYNPIIKK